jgi:hypothetical protein
MMEEDDVNIVDDNDISYGKSNKGLQVIILSIRIATNQ